MSIVVISYTFINNILYKRLLITKLHHTIRTGPEFIFRNL